MKPPPFAALRRKILRWYRAHGRDLPWRSTRDPYAILVSEIMLQQTQVDRVIPAYRAFLSRFPTIRSLSEASLADVLRAWSGLGYNGRARRLWLCAREVVASHGGLLPSGEERLRELPGIGRYTAAAVASFAFGARAAVVDTNVRRVLGRAVDGSPDCSDARAWDLAAAALPRGASGDWNQALMDVGAAFCRPAPHCDACPARVECRFARAQIKGGATRLRVNGDAVQARKRQPPFANSRRFFRGRVVKALAASRSLSFLALGEQVKAGFGVSDLPWLETLLDELHRDGLIAIDRPQKLARLP